VLKPLESAADVKLIIANAPEPVRVIVLAALNPALFGELEEIEQEPARCVGVLNRLSTNAAVELVSHLRSPEAVSLAAGVRRSAIARAALTRAEELRVCGDVRENPTRKALESGDPVAALLKLHTVDARSLEEWIDTDHKTAITALRQVLPEASQRGTQNVIARVMLSRDVELGHLVKPRTLVRVIAGYEGPVTAAVVGAVERCLEATWSDDLLLSSFSMTTPSGANALAWASLRARLLLGAVTPAELRAEIGVRAGRSARLRHPGASNAPGLFEVLLCVRDVELIAVGVEMLDGIAGVDEREELAVRWFKRAGSRDDVRAVLLLELGGRFAELLRAGALSAREVERFIDYLSQQAFALGPRDALRVLGAFGVFANQGECAVFTACLDRVPGAARAMVAHARAGGGWMSEMVLERVHAKLGENTQAWRVVLSQLPTWNGALDELVEAAAVACE
jgi:hypothetical protein